MNKELQDKLTIMCSNLAGTYRAKHDVKADIEQEAWLACLEALPKYVPEDYVDPEQFFYFKALNATSKYYKTHDKLIKPPKRTSRAIEGILGGKGSLEQVEALSGLLVRSYDDMEELNLRNSDDQAQEYEDKDSIKHLTKRMTQLLTTEELQVLTIRYFHDETKVMTFREVADIMTKGGTPISGMTVKNREERALKVIRGIS